MHWKTRIFFLLLGEKKRKLFEFFLYFLEPRHLFLLSNLFPSLHGAIIASTSCFHLRQGGWVTYWVYRHLNIWFFLSLVLDEKLNCLKVLCICVFVTMIGSPHPNSLFFLLVHIRFFAPFGPLSSKFLWLSSLFYCRSTFITHSIRHWLKELSMKYWDALTGWIIKE